MNADQVVHTANKLRSHTALESKDDITAALHLSGARMERSTDRRVPPRLGLDSRTREAAQRSPTQCSPT